MARLVDPTFVAALFKNKQVKAYHPITCLNPDEWFTPVKMEITDENKLFIIGEKTCWFNLEQCEIRDTINVKD